ncbi:hypothetical protein C8R43DRAFT_1084982 [Mycena crocata]|nr:hypothetical protein C8R43DRAFT_1084982 [Mycena crocata]
MPVTSDSKIVLITGANKGIGFEIAKQLATERPGYHILIGSRDAERGEKAAAILQEAGLSVEALVIDAANDASIKTAAQTVESKFGRLGVLINNAGILGSGEPGTRALYESTFSVNVFGPVVVTETFIPLLEKSAAIARVALGGVNVHNPGFAKTDLNGNRGTGTVEDAAKGAVRLAVLGDDGET